jgi:hypothetical protein
MTNHYFWRIYVLIRGAAKAFMAVASAKENLIELITERRSCRPRSYLIVSNPVIEVAQ